MPARWKKNVHKHPYKRDRDIDAMADMVAMVVAVPDKRASILDVAVHMLDTDPTVGSISDAVVAAIFDDMRRCGACPRQEQTTLT